MKTYPTCFLVDKETNEATGQVAHFCNSTCRNLFLATNTGEPGFDGCEWVSAQDGCDDETVADDEHCYHCGEPLK